MSEKVEETKNILKLYKVEYKGSFVVITSNYTEDKAKKEVAYYMIRVHYWRTGKLSYADDFIATEIGTALENTLPEIIYDHYYAVD